MNDGQLPAPAPLAMLDLNLLRVFEAVFRAQSLTHAARELRLTQPAVSNALGRLRGYLDDPLFVREGRGMVPTPRARALMPPIAQALTLVRSAFGEPGHVFDPAAADRNFVIGMREVVEGLLLSRTVHALEKVAPHVRIASVRFDRHLLSRALASRTLDLAVDVRLPRAEGIKRETILSEAMCVAMRVGHPLAQQPLTFETWLSASHVAVSARREGHTLEEVWLAQRGHVRRVAVRCQHYYAACAVVAETDHLLVLSRRYAERMQRLVALQLADPPLPLPPLELCLYWHVSAERDAGLLWLLSTLRTLRERAEDPAPPP